MLIQAFEKYVPRNDYGWKFKGSARLISKGKAEQSRLGAKIAFVP